MWRGGYGQTGRSGVERITQRPWKSQATESANWSPLSRSQEASQGPIREQRKLGWHLIQSFSHYLFNTGKQKPLFSSAYYVPGTVFLPLILLSPFYRWAMRGTKLSVSRSVVFDSLWPMDCSRQAPLSMEFSRQEYWSGLPFPSLGDLPDSGSEAGSPALQASSYPPVKSSWPKGRH